MSEPRRPKIDLLAGLLTIAWCATLMAAAPAALAGEDSSQAAEAPYHGPWDLARLKAVPEHQWGEVSDGVREVYYESEPFRERKTRVFAYYARPAEGDGPFPAMVLVHGGGGTAFAEWARLWAERGYAALAMDLAGKGPQRQTLADGGPDQGDPEKFGPAAEPAIREMWTYHAVAAVIRGHSLLASLPEVDAGRIGITGISWGGYLTCIVAGLDDRLKAAVPVYGCGFLHENSVWLPRLTGMEAARRQRWVDNYDPSRYLPGARCPMLFVNGTNDFAYPLDSYQKSYRAVSGPRTLCITVRMPHGHPQGWQPVEIGRFVDSILLDASPLPQLGLPAIAGGRLAAAFEAANQPQTAQLHFTSDQGAWQQRQWLSRPADLSPESVSAALPAERPLVAFLTVTDDRGATVSTEHVELSE